jgi:undecaprenyl-diphosphatase
VRERPFVAHPAQTILLAPASSEPSFPSDHAVAAFAIAFSVLLLGGRLAGALFLSGAFVVGMTRVFVGLHYPGDVAGGAIVGLVSALVIYYAGRHRWTPIVRLLSRLSDPLVAPVWRTGEAVASRRRARSTASR